VGLASGRRVTAQPARQPAAADWPGAGLAAVIAAGRGPDDRTIDGLVAASVTPLGRRGEREERARLGEAVLGAGALTDLLADRAVTDLLVNGDGSIWVDRGDGVTRVERQLPPGDVRPLAVRLAALAGRRLDDAQPWVDGLLPQGIRLHAILPPLADQGAHVSLRVPRASPGWIADLVDLGACCPELGEVLSGMMRASLSFLVCGGTGSGKTTLLGGLLAECDPGERIVLVEDVRELGPAHPHVVRLQGRAPNIEGAGGVALTDLVRQALRMRPDRLVVGEVRGPEVRDLLVALNTGHRGSAGTVHANTAADVPARLQALGSLAGLTPSAVDAQVLSGVEVVVAMRREGAQRRVVEIGVVSGGPGGVQVVEAIASPSSGRLRRGPGWVRLEAALRSG
jgi:pilus assembly protein CpaF